LEQEREGTELGLQSAQDNLTLARAEYNQVIAGRDSQLLDLETLPQDIELAEFRVEQLQRDLDPSLALNLELAQLDLQTLEQQKEDAYVYAPWAGTILSVEQSPGGQVGIGTPIVTLFDPTELEFRTNNLSERDLDQLEVGQAGTIILKAYSDDPLDARIVRIMPQAAGMVGDAASFPVVLELDPTEFELLPGMTGRVEIESRSE
jgi:multidrug resistance efflux pump